MTNLDINKAETSSYDSIDDFTIDSKAMDSPADQKETEWINSRAEDYWGYFNSIGDLKSAFLMKTIWNVGKGWTTESNSTKVILDKINGWGKDTFDDILFNMDLCMRVFGDSFAQIIRNEKSGTLINLIPLDPKDVKIVTNKQGRIIRYEFINVVKGTKEKFKPEEILHFSNNRLGNQIHGISDIEALESTILADAQSFENINQITKFQAKPFILFKLKTDDEAKITALAAKIRTLREKGDDMFIPDDENIISYDVITVNPSSILMEWRTDLRNKFYRMLGMPLILFGATGSTESGGKMEVFAHETVFEYGQKYIEKQIWAQLGLKINLIPPNSLLDNLQTDEKKDAAQGLEIQPSDTTAGVGA